MFLFILKSHVRSSEFVASTYCWLSIPAMSGVSLVITRRVVKSDYGRTFGVLIITNSLLSNAVVMRVAITSV